MKSCPAVDGVGGLVFAGSHDGNVYALDPQVRRTEAEGACRPFPHPQKRLTMLETSHNLSTRTNLKCRKEKKTICNLLKEEEERPPVVSFIMKFEAHILQMGLFVLVNKTVDLGDENILEKSYLTTETITKSSKAMLSFFSLT